MIELSRKSIIKKNDLELVASQTRLGTTFFVYRYVRGRFHALDAFDNYIEAREYFYSLINQLAT